MLYCEHVSAAVKYTNLGLMRYSCLQVSKCEKFGYGYMVTQVAATSPGMLALLNTG